MQVHWLIGASSDLFNLQETKLASIRLRAGAVLKASPDFPKLRSMTAGFQMPALPPDVLIVGKLPEDRVDFHLGWVKAIKDTKDRGGKVILDYTDNHLERTQPSAAQNFYQKTLELADSAVCSGPLLKSSLGKYFAKPIHIIGDALEVDCIPPEQRCIAPAAHFGLGITSTPDI